MSSKPNVLIAMSTMMTGGIEKSLISLLNALDNNINITLLLNEKRGLLLSSIPQWVKVKEIVYSPEIIRERKQGRKKFLRNLISKLRFRQFIKYYKTISAENRLQHDEMIIHRFRRFQNSIIQDEVFDKTYDLAVAYADFEQMILVADRIKARRKITFFHTQINGLTNNVRQYYSIFQNFNSLYCVSKDLTTSMQESFPDLKERIYLFPHIINEKQIRDAGNQYMAEWRNNVVRILSVGRLERQKGFDLIPDIASKLITAGIKFQWIILGEGPKYDMITKQLNKLGLNDYVLLGGVKKNPYPYFASCDIYVQPSRYEGYCLTLAEARVFAKPIVATYFDGSREQLENGKCGMIIECDINKLYNAIKELCLDTALRTKYSDALKQQKIENAVGAEIFLSEAKNQINS